MHSSGIEPETTRRLIVLESFSHEVQPQQLVGASRKIEVVVEENEKATIGSCGSQEQLQRQQQAECQLQLQQRLALRNDLRFNPKRKTFKSIFNHLCEYDNLLLAFKNAKKRKSKKEYVRKFENNLQNELYQLQWELMTGTYQPKPLKTFTVRDPKTRKISASNFRDRVIHHAICNLLVPIYEPRFIEDTFANRKGKGTKAIVERFDYFKGKFRNGFALKADIRHYFDSVNHGVLLEILSRRIKDKKFLNLIKIILENHKGEAKGTGMPLGNLTSQFFANLYLGELDNFAKHELHVKYYIRYVDDFVILGTDAAQIEKWQIQISMFLSEKLHLTLHPQKTKIIPLSSGVQLVGLRIFKHHKLLKKSNVKRIWKRIARLKDTDKEHIRLSMAGWEGYARTANTYKLRKRINLMLED